MGDALGARVRAVGRREGVVDVQLRKRGEGIGEPGIVARLARLEAGVLETQDAAGLEALGEAQDIVADDRGRERDLGADQLPEPPGDGRHRELGVDTLGAPEMRAQHRRGSPLRQQLDRR